MSGPLTDCPLVVYRCIAQRACQVLSHTEIHNIYGPTEATIWVSSWKCNGGNFEGVSTSPIGPPMANTQLYVLDSNLRPVPVGESHLTPTSRLLTVSVCNIAFARFVLPIKCGVS